MRIFLLAIMMQFFAGCESYDKNKPTEFFKIKEKIHDYKNGSEFRKSDSAKIEYFILSNPPNDSSLLKKIVEEYNLKTMPIDTIRKYSDYNRVFFRETKCLTRNYDESKPYPPESEGEWGFSCSLLYGSNQYVGYHYYKKENLMETGYTSYHPSIDRGYDWEYSYQFGSYFGDTHYQIIKIKDIDLFYEENRKKPNR